MSKHTPERRPDMYKTPAEIDTSAERVQETAKSMQVEPDANTSASLIADVLILLRSWPDHFSAAELADLHDLCGAEITKRDTAVCGGQKYLDAHWFERGELPPVGTECEFHRIDGSWVKAWTVGLNSYGLMVVQLNDEHISYAHSLSRGSYRPLRTEREVLIEILLDEQLTPSEMVDAILAAGFKRGEA